MLFHLFTAVIACLSLWGAYLNAGGKKSGFYVWGTANLAWILVDGSRGLWAQAALYTAFLAMNIYGWYKWKNK